MIMNENQSQQEVDIGDLVFFENGECTTVGFVMRIEERYVLLSNRETRKDNGSLRKPGFFGSLPDEKQWKEEYKYWENYEIIKKTPYLKEVVFAYRE